jgi:DNA topoisomerase I
MQGRIYGGCVFEPADEVVAVTDPKDAADLAGLRYVSDGRPGICRRKSGKGFTYFKANSERLADPSVLARIKKLAIPPAWTEVWICPFADGHIQATGRDARGRKQYKYHEQFREIRDSNKFEHVVALAKAVPSIRARVQQHLALRGLAPRQSARCNPKILLRTSREHRERPFAV